MTGGSVSLKTDDELMAELNDCFSRINHTVGQMSAIVDALHDTDLRVRAKDAWRQMKLYGAMNDFLYMWRRAKGKRF